LVKVEPVPRKLSYARFGIEKSEAYQDAVRSLRRACYKSVRKREGRRTFMVWNFANIFPWLFDPRHGMSDRLIPRWLFLRALGLIYFSAFLSLLFQIRGLIGPSGILPAAEYLQAVAHSASHVRYWYAPTLLWFSSSSHMLMALSSAGLLASLLLTLNFWPRGMLAVCFVCFLSFVSAASEFSGYQSDGMLLEAGFISLFFAPAGWLPGLGRAHPPMRASYFLLLWEWFRIYFESGVAKIASGDPEWRHFTAMDDYYQNGPLPTWIGWYVQHLPHSFHAATAFATLAIELVLVWMLFLPRPARIVCFCIVTPLQIGIILTANYAFLNYLVLALGFLLLDDRFIAQVLPRARKESYWNRRCSNDNLSATSQVVPETKSVPFESPSILAPADTPAAEPSAEKESFHRSWLARLQPTLTTFKIAITAFIFAWLFYSTTAQMLWMMLPGFPLPASPVAMLEPSRIAGRYGLFAVMTRGRYEIEFQGSNDGQTWVEYPFRFKPQDPAKPPGIYAPYQPRFDWNLWFASLGEWRDNPLVPRTEERLLAGDPDVLSLFAGNPFANHPPREVRAVLWQYWFTTPAEKRQHGLWWRRELLGLYAPTIEREPDGKLGVLEWPTQLPPHE
jgi:lipase maturation factor 1